MEKAYTNGSLWRYEDTVAVLQQLTDGLFCLLKVESGVLNIIVDPVHAGKWQYAAEEIPERLKDWEPVLGDVSQFVKTNSLGSTMFTAEEIRAAKATEEKKTLSSVKRKVKDGKI